MRRIIIIGLSIAVSAFFLWLVLRDVPMEAILLRFQAADVGWLLACFFITTMALYTRGIRWRGLVDNRVSQRDAFFMMGITFMLNQLPLRAGEIARSLIATRHSIPFLTAATSILIERLVDTLLVVLAILISISLLPNIPPEVARTAFIFGILGIVAFITLIFIARKPAWFYALIEQIENKLPFLQKLPLKKFLTHILEGLQPMSRPQTLIHVLVWSLISWGLSFTAMWSLIMALGIVVAQPVLAAVVTVALASFSIAIPVSIAGIGPFEAAVVAGGSLVGMNEIEAISLGFLAHGLTVAVYVFWGVIGMLGLGLSLSDVVGQQPDTQKTDSEYHDKVNE
ncbi:hypothetical protein MASR2M15_12540 [Anaerolineales bacterium]